MCVSEQVSVCVCACARAPITLLAGFRDTLPQDHPLGVHKGEEMTPPSGEWLSKRNFPQCSPASLATSLG